MIYASVHAYRGATASATAITTRKYDTMKAVRKFATYLAVASVALLAVAFMLDLMSLNPAYDLADAVVVNVQPDTKWGFIDEDWRTLVQFADGYRDYAPGALGEPGDALKVARQNGTMSLFGWTGDRRR